MSFTSLKKIFNDKETKELTLPYRQPSVYFPISANRPFERFQTDLMDMGGTYNKYPIQMNRGYRYILGVIDVFSRKVFVRPLKSKTDKEILDNFVKIMKEIKSNIPYEYKNSYILLDSDNEGAFQSRNFMNYCENNKIVQNFVNPDDVRAKGVIERWNGTMRRLILLYTTYKESKSWIDVLEQLTDFYNNKLHSTIKMTPNEATEKENQEDIQDIYEEKKNIAKSTIGNIPIGAKVRTLIRKTALDKKTTVRWSKTIHTVEKQEGNNYYVSERALSYKKDELQISKATTRTKIQPDSIQAKKKAEKFESQKKLDVKLSQVGVSQNNIVDGKRARKKREIMDI